MYLKTELIPFFGKFFQSRFHFLFEIKSFGHLKLFLKISLVHMAMYSVPLCFFFSAVRAGRSYTSKYTRVKGYRRTMRTV